MTSNEYHEARTREFGAGWLSKLAREQHTQDAVKPWVVLAYKRNVCNVRDFAIVAGYNRWTGESIHWIVPSLTDDERYDISAAVEVT